MTISIHQYLCLTDNYGALVHDSTTGATACVDVPEAGPTLAALAEQGWNLTDILITHHHADHIQGVPEVRAKFPNAKIWGPAKDAARIPFLDHQVKEGDTARVGSLRAKVIETPGHTLGHIAYHFEDDAVAFCGDTLFSLGCGRVFETPLAVMWSSLAKLAALPGETQIYCGHEYTQANGRFAITIEPDNPILKARIEEIARLRAERRADRCRQISQPSLPPIRFYAWRSRRFRPRSGWAARTLRRYLESSARARTDFKASRSSWPKIQGAFACRTVDVRRLSMSSSEFAFLGDVSAVGIAPANGENIARA